MFDIILFPSLIVTIAAANRIAGSGDIGNSSFVGGALIASYFGLIVGFHHSSILWGITASFWVYGWFQTGHGTAYDMGSNPSVALSGRKAPLSYVIDPLCKALGKPLGGVFYCWVFMGLKGFLMHLPLGPWAILMAIQWPAAYWVGNCLVPKTIDGEMVAELLSGAFSGAVLAAYVVTQ